MKLGFDLAIDGVAAPAQGNTGLASWYAPGLSDELGDRLLMFDNSSAPSLELLRFRRELTLTPGFEVALRRRVERLSHFRHPAFGRVRAVEYLGPGDGLALLSNHTAGKRLSEILRDARGPALATALIQQLTPALGSLQQYDDGVAHGALAASRIVVTPDGRLTIVEHVLGPALERLRLPASRLRSELGIPVPPTTAAHGRLDTRADYFQLGLIALSLLLGRRLGADESQENLARLLELVARNTDPGSAGLFDRLRTWLERALQLDDQVFESPRDAEAALHDLSSAGVVHAALPEAAAPQAQGSVDVENSGEDVALVLEPEPAPVPDVPEQAPPHILDAGALDRVVPATPLPGSSELPEVLFHSEPVHHRGAPPGADLDGPVRFRELDPVEPVPSEPPHARERASSALARPGSKQDAHRAGSGSSVFVEIDSREFRPNAGAEGASQANVEPRPSMQHPRATFSKTPQKPRPGPAYRLVAVLALCAIAEGVIIAMLLLKGGAAAPHAVVVETAAPGADVLVDGRSAGVTPVQLNIGTDTRSIRVVDTRPRESDARRMPERSAPQPEHPPATPARMDVGTAGVVPAAPPRSGGIRLLSPIEVEVFEGDKWLGSSATGIVSASAGRHEFELVNSILGYRTRQVVNVRAGQVSSVRVTPPNGRLSINAVPWAEVWIDGKSIGETPLGNVSVPLGEHEIVFRHPELGEQRRTALVRHDTVTRVSVNLQR